MLKFATPAALEWICDVQQTIRGEDPPPPPPPAPPPPPPPPAPPAPPAPPPPGETEAQRQVREANAEAAHHRISARTARTELQEAQTALAASENASAEVRAEAQRQVDTIKGVAEKFKTRAIEAEIKASAVRYGIVDTDLVALIPKTGIAMSDDGTITGIEAAITAHKTAKPNLYSSNVHTPPPPRSGSDTPPPPPGNPGPTSIKEMKKGEFDDARKGAIAGLRRR